MDARVIAWVYFLATLTVAVEASSKIDCNDGKFYIRADPDSCSHFYKCDNGRPVRFTCPDGLYFNPAIYVCDWPYNVQCGSNKHDSNSNKHNGNSNKHNSASNNNQGQYDGYGQDEDYYDNGQVSNNWYTGNGISETPHYVVTAPEEGPSIQEPYGPIDRPRPKVDDNQSSGNHPYYQYVENDIDIR